MIKTKRFLLVICVVLGSGTAGVGRLLAEELSAEQMVVMKVRPEFASLLPKGHARSTGIPSIDVALSSAGATGVERLHPNAKIRRDLPRLDLWLEVKLPVGIAPLVVVDAVRSCSDVLHVEVVQIPTVTELPDDPRYGNQYFLPQIMAPDAWDYQKGDSAIVVAIVDNGTDFDHEDLWGNVWTNELEASGVPGVDDDGNGYVDDVHGYDVAQSDPDPSPTPPDPEGWWDHGTLTAGAAAAVTNNAIGVAAVSWNCEFMPVKASYDNNPASIARGFQGIEYAATSGADVINCSWGHHGNPSEYDQEVIDYATALGSLVVAAAGNEAIGDYHWPGSYRNVVNVTWVNANDHRAGSATWGRTVDISAPGVNIHTTRPNGNYGSASGSSLASPIAAGLAGLIKSWQPSLGPYELSRQLVLTADNIDDQNPGYEGLLGTGRINAYSAVTETELVEQPYVEMIGWAVSDSPPGGNGDGWILQGEEGRLWISYWSYTVSPAIDATISLTSNAPGIEIINGVSEEDIIPADTTGTSTEALTFRLLPDGPSQSAVMFITFEDAGGFWQQDTLSIPVGLSPVLLVDDDGGYNNIEDYYRVVLDTLGVPHLLWNRNELGMPDSTALLDFPLIIWACESSFPSLEPDDRSSLGSYLNHGGSLYISGQDVGWDLCDPGSSNSTPDAVAWYNEYIRARYIAYDSGIQSVDGVVADPIGDGLSFSIYQPGRLPAAQHPDVIEPYGDDTSVVFNYSPTANAAVRYREDFGVVYTAFGFEAVAAGQDIDPTDHTGKRTMLMERILDYLGPVQHTPLLNTEDMSAPVTIIATLTEPGGLETLWLNYRTDSVADWTTVLMTATGEGEYEVVLPGPGEATDLWYYFEAENTSYMWRYPLEGEFHVYIGPDMVAPELSDLTQLPATINPQAPRTIQVRAVDDLGLDFQSGMVHYIAGGTDGESPLSFEGWIGTEAVFEGAVEPIGSYGDTVYYVASVADTAMTPNRGYSDTLFYVHGLEDFETSLNAWDPETEWVRQTGGSPHSGEWIARDSEGYGYPNSADNSMTLANGLDLSGVATARVSFWVLHGLEENHDYCYLEASNDGIDWTQLVALTGSEFNWTKHEASLDAFTGEGSEQVLLRFRLVSDEEVALQGVYLDDVLIETEVVSSSDAPIPLPAAPELTIQPNPSQGEVFLHLVGASGKRTVNVYDVSGKLVRTLSISAERTPLRWDGRDAHGRTVGSGLYFVTVPAYRLQSKVVLIR